MIAYQPQCITSSQKLEIFLIKSVSSIPDPWLLLSLHLVIKRDTEIQRGAFQGLIEKQVANRQNICFRTHIARKCETQKISISQTYSGFA